MITQVNRWTGTAWEVVPPPRAGLLYTVLDPATGKSMYFETRQERDAWLKKHEAVAA